MIAEKKEIMCSGCGRILLPAELGKTWERCAFCEAPVCFACTHYIGTHVRELDRDYVRVLRVCKNCRIKKM